ncbi:filamentous hemagglutinin N-terminal domain-containing protein, partial [Helicobacter sp. 13S00482-2]|uniref:filamentous hemagglutinin N-terminal domain-containing protein n=1 Tax=Helicobacter sp. 13S00482-2 TaxID=1476200 RepID=UPI00117B046A
NHIPIINISSPNPRGISNNYFKEFNVNKEGLILNNSKDLFTLSELAGLINGNIHLKDKEASLILNQITGDHLSTLLGFIEIAGRKADLIIANPNGITCNGCGFINSSSSTLSTGSISLEEINKLNDLKDLNNHLTMMVQRGHINIEALNASNIPILNLIARSLKVKGDLLANSLHMILGSNQVQIDLSKQSSILLYEPIEITDEATSKTKIALALDVAYLGSIVSKSIYLVATEEGIGVKNSGRIAMMASEQEGDGGFIIDVNGKVEISKPKEAYEAYKQEQ